MTRVNAAGWKAAGLIATGAIAVGLGGFRRIGGFALLAAVVLMAAVPAQARMDDMEPPMAYGRTPGNLYALWEPNIFTHNVGLLTLQITNVGMIGNYLNDDFSAGWRNGEYLWASGLWIGAIGSDAEPHVSTGVPAFELRPDLDPIWTVYESFEGIKNGKRMGASDPSAADDDGDGLFDEDFHDKFDNDGDGRIDEDYEAIGQQMFSSQYRDDTAEAVSQINDHEPLNILVRQRSFQWSTSGLNEFVGFEFEVINTGEQRLKEMYLGFFSDSDAGPKTTPRYWTDDFVGWKHIDTTVVDLNASGACSVQEISIDAAYMWDALDNGTSIIGGDVDGVFGSLFMGHTTDDTGLKAPQQVGLTTVAWFSSTGQDSDPQNDLERYTLLASGTKPPRNANKPDDYRYVIAAGPFAQLNPGESLTFQTAYVIGEGRPATPDAVPSGFARNAISAQRVFNGQYVDADGDPLTGIDGKERCLRALEPGDEVVWDDPCDTLTTTDPPHRSPECKWVDADCNPCTGIEGKEALISWVGSTAPPPANSNTDPELRIFNPEFRAFALPDGDREVILEWDNASETAVDPFAPVDDQGNPIDQFEGYRVWRVDNWQRPEGSVGPAPEEWMLIAEFRNNPRDGLGQQSPTHLREVRENINPVGKTEDGKDIYPIGRYKFQDRDGIINGKVHFYAITGFKMVEVLDPTTGRPVEVELAGQPTAVEAEAVIPRWDAQTGAVSCDAIKIVPNPYRGAAEWDLIPSDRDPTGTKIAFRNLPETVSTIRIYTMSGDLVETAEHDGRDGNGTYFWNLITRNGQNAVSGIYLYSVEHPEGVCRGRFVIIR